VTLDTVDRPNLQPIMYPAKIAANDKKISPRPPVTRTVTPPRRSIQRRDGLDPMRDEALNILADLVDLSQGPKTASAVTRPLRSRSNANCAARRSSTVGEAASFPSLWFRHVVAVALAWLLMVPHSIAQAIDRHGNTDAADKLWAFVGNGGWMLIPIAACLVATVFLITNGVTRTSREHIGPVGHEQTVKALLRQNDHAGADKFCRENPSTLTKVARVGIGLIGEGQQAVTEGLTAQLAAEQLRLHTRFSYLRALAICTPLLGLLGSLAGIINALMQYDAPAARASPLAEAIGDALVPSAAGLLVGIIALAAFYILRERASAAMLRVQDVVNSAFRRIVYDASGVRSAPQPE
jgi:biopolymer transport protein ExbB